MTTSLVNIKDINFIINGQRITGFGEGASIQLEASGDSTTFMNSIDGHSQVVKNTAVTMSITLSLVQGSPGDNFLLYLLSQMKILDSVQTFSVLMTGAGGNIFQCTECIITKYPNRTYGTEGQLVEWVINSSSNFLVSTI